MSNIYRGSTVPGAGTTARGNASDVDIEDAGGIIAATNVEDALQEIQTALDVEETALVTHMSDTTTHGTTGDIVGTTDAQALTNKSLDDTTTTITDTADDTKRIVFDAGGTTATKTTITAAQTADRVITLPDATDTLVGKATTDTLTNKTLTSPTINGGAINSATVGATTPSTGAFTTLSASGLLSANGGQVAFPAAQNPSADANTLDDYEEGTWTPTVQDDTLSDAEGQTYTTQVGYYTKIGNSVHVEGRIVMSSLGTLTTTQQMRIAGLPFTTRNTSNAVGTVVIGQASSLSITAGYNVTGRVVANNTVANMTYWNAAGGTGQFLLSNLTASGDIFFSIDYSTT